MHRFMKRPYYLMYRMGKTLDSKEIRKALDRELDSLQGGNDLAYFNLLDLFKHHNASIKDIEMSARELEALHRESQLMQARSLFAELKRGLNYKGLAMELMLYHFRIEPEEIGTTWREIGELIEASDYPDGADDETGS